jgi:hypothetical protein
MNQNENKMYEQKYLKYKAKYIQLKTKYALMQINKFNNQSQTGSGTSPSTLVQLGISSLPPINPNFFNVINNLPSSPVPDFVRIVDGQSIASQLGSGMSPSTLIQLAASSLPPIPPIFYNTISEVVSSDIPVPANTFAFPIRG